MSSRTRSKLFKSSTSTPKTKYKPRTSSTNPQKIPTIESDLSDLDTGDKSDAYDSDALDEFSEPEDEAEEVKKRKRGSPKKSATPAKKSPRKRQRRAHGAGEDDDGGGVDMEDGQELVGVIVQAPTTGRVPPGRISQNTLDFLRKLKDPECNDRQWFKLHEPVYRVLEKEWKDFVEEFTLELSEVDPQIPHLPPNDVIHRIYRDIRFSNDKTPYKSNISASFSRSGRKGIFAAYHISVKPDGESLIAAGSWCPGRNELATIRSHILRDSSRLREIITAPDFVELFGPAEHQSNGERSNIFGRDDELKVAPKGIDKNHVDIDLLKCRSFAVIHKFKDHEVLEPDFKTKLANIAQVMRPFVRCLNDMMTLPPDNGAEFDSDD